MAADREQVKEFLLRLKMTLSQEGKLAFVEREKNVQSLAMLGMLPSEVPSVLRELSVSDYSEGPLDDDRGRPIQWWVFGPNYCGIVLYIKVAVYSGRCICMSFHEAEYNLTCPFRREVEK
ncbi:MAG TPA: type II toxin-antitoxin system MqsR family toxin [Firmicutes bacterium]|nr:type II toxin-antitoxin system MqsR family toxin [Candidatus Fermentithermobacillaceae bacterium]